MKGGGLPDDFLLLAGCCGGEYTGASCSLLLDLFSADMGRLNRLYCFCCWSAAVVGVASASHAVEFPSSSKTTGCYAWSQVRTPLLQTGFRSPTCFRLSISCPWTGLQSPSAPGGSWALGALALDHQSLVAMPGPVPPCTHPKKVWTS